jgi:predicted phosphodiesterase
LEVPAGDVLIHAGDFTERGEKYEVDSFLNWFASQPHRHKVFVAGNHEFFCEDSPEEFLQQVSRFPDVHYLCDSGITLDDVNYWGSPFTPRFYDWAFNCDRGPDIQSHWDCIPEDTEVLITHGPPHGNHDKNYQGSNEGCVNLAVTLTKIRSLKLHVCGHIHLGYGLSEIDGHTLVNASVLNERYELVNKPIVLETGAPRMLSGAELTVLCEQMHSATDRETVEKLKLAIMEGFYGKRVLPHKISEEEQEAWIAEQEKWLARIRNGEAREIP